MKYSKKEMIHIGLLLKSVDDFERKTYVNNVPDAKNKDRVYIQVRASATVNKKTVWYGKYVGKKDQYTPEDLAKATQAIRQRYHNHVNSELAQYNCKIEDFK